MCSFRLEEPSPSWRGAPVLASGRGARRTAVARHVIVNRFSAFCAMRPSTQARPSDPSSKKDLKSVGASIMAAVTGSEHVARSGRWSLTMVSTHDSAHEMSGQGMVSAFFHRRAGCAGIVEELLREAQIGIPQTVVQGVVIPVQHVLDSFGQRISCTIQLLRELAAI